MRVGELGTDRVPREREEEREGEGESLDWGETASQPWPRIAGGRSV